MIPKPQSFEELTARYGRPWESDQARVAFESVSMTLWRSDIWESSYNRQWRGPFTRIYCNREIISLLDQTFLVLDIMGLLDELKTYDGCWNIRKIRGSETKWSVHSFGLALDFNAELNPLGAEPTFTPRFLDLMQACGWTCGARFARKDGMHFQWADNC